MSSGQTDWVKRCITWEVEGIRQRGRPKKTWWDSVKNDMESLVSSGTLNSSISYLNFNSHFPGVPGLASTKMSPFWILLELRVIEMGVAIKAIRHAKLQSKCRH